jgi:uncharacterized protein YjbI with pentapeptide repeats
VGANLTGVNLMNAILDDLAEVDGVTALCGTVAASTQACAPLEQASVSCLVLDSANVEGASFQNIDFSNLFLGGATGADFFQGVAIHTAPDARILPNLTRTNFSGANIAGMNFDNLNLTDAALFSLAAVCDENACASFEKSIFGSSKSEILLNLSGRDFMTASIAGASFNNVSLAGTDLTEVGNLCTADMSACLTVTGKNSSLLGADFSGLDLTLVSFGTGADKVINFRFAQFVNADLSALDLSERDFTGADFTAANLSAVNFENATLASSQSGCNTETGATVCTNFAGANLCGVDARGAVFEGSFVGASTVTTMNCTISATFSGATFVNVDFDNTTNFTNANLDGSLFDPSVSFCAATNDCLVISGASLVGATLAGIDFDTAPDDYFADVLDDDLSQIDFSGSNLSGKTFENADLSFANLSQANLSGAILRGTDFNNTQFALGAVSGGNNCTLTLGATPVDLRGADLRNADFSRALNFQRDCILVDANTIYDVDTEFPPGFDLLAELDFFESPPPGSAGTAIPEPSQLLLRGSALALLGLLVLWRRNRRADA